MSPPITASAFATAARALVGSPWHHQGRLPGVGLDCIGVAVMAARSLGLTIQDVTNYGLPPYAPLMLQWVGNNADRTPDLILGDGMLLCFRPLAGVDPSHFGVQVDAETMVHAHQKMGHVVTVPLRIWKRLLHSTWRVRGVDYEGDG